LVVQHAAKALAGHEMVLDDDDGDVTGHPAMMTDRAGTVGRSR